MQVPHTRARAQELTHAHTHTHTRTGCSGWKAQLIRHTSTSITVSGLVARTVSRPTFHVTSAPLSVHHPDMSYLHTYIHTHTHTHTHTLASLEATAVVCLVCVCVCVPYLPYDAAMVCPVQLHDRFVTIRCAYGDAGVAGAAEAAGPSDTPPRVSASAPLWPAAALLACTDVKGVRVCRMVAGSCGHTHTHTHAHTSACSLSCAWIRQLLSASVSDCVRTAAADDTCLSLCIDMPGRTCVCVCVSTCACVCVTAPVRVCGCVRVCHSVPVRVCVVCRAAPMQRVPPQHV